MERSADPEMLWGGAARWDPDIVGLGAAHDAWQVEFDRLGSLIRAHPRESANPRTATAAVKDRNAYLVLSPWERRFILGLRTERTGMLSGHAPDIATAAHATGAWLSGARPSA